MSSMSRIRYEKFLEDCSKKNYIEVLDILKIEFGDFLRNAEIGRNVPFCGLKARKLSIKLRDMLKIFREKSLELENLKKQSRDENSDFSESENVEEIGEDSDGIVEF